MLWRRRDEHRSDPGAGRDGAVAIVPALDVRGDSLVLSLADELHDAESGLGFVYRALDRAAAYCQARDALLVLEDEALGRQAFRLGRAPIEDSWAQEIVRTADPGLYITPSTLDPVVADGVANMCAVALQLDVARHASLHDPLTGLLNRRAFDDVLGASAARAERYDWPFALILVDIDGFSAVSEEHGQAAANHLLRAVGRELRSRLRNGDAAGRVGPDEFGLILPAAGDGTEPEILSRLERVAENTRHGASFSAGTAVAPTDSTNAAALYRIADARLYNNKRWR